MFWLMSTMGLARAGQMVWLPRVAECKFWQNEYFK